jgi:flavorubredoxin
MGSEMRNVELFCHDSHRFVLLNESSPGEEEGVRSNQYLIAHGGHGVLLDPGGLGVMPHVLAELLRHTQLDDVVAVFLSHQDPDIVGGLVSWVALTTRAKFYISTLWVRFLPHFGLVDGGRFIGVPDEGMACEPAAGIPLRLIPAHFLHSEGNFTIFDPVAHILFSADIGAAMMPDNFDEPFVDDFAAHLPFIEGFHRRYMTSNRAIRCWLANLDGLEIDMIAPQHGPVYRGHAVGQLLEWLRDLVCGVDLLEPGGRFGDGHGNE